MWIFGRIYVDIQEENVLVGWNSIYKGFEVNVYFIMFEEQ